MLYEEYAKKIRRYAQIRDSILRFKIPIICTIAAIILLWAGFLATKGIITEQATGAEQYTYGDSISFKAKALFSDVALEYSSDGGETWSETQPKMPGEYLVRAVSKRSFGMISNGDAWAFSIQQKSATLSVKDATVEWRTMPSVEAQGLVGSDKLERASVRMGADTIGQVDAVADVASAVIINSQGEDVTAAYALSAPTRSITVTPRALTLKARDVKREYNGESLLPDGYEVLSGSVIEGQAVSVSFKPYDLISVGSEKISFEKVVITENGVDVTSNYSISMRDGSATVIKRVITVVSDGAVKQFDGKKLEFPEYRVGGSTVGTDKLSVTTCNEEFFAPMPVGKAHITGVTITDPVTGEDRSSNYDIRITAGTLQITKRSIMLETPTASKTYDTKPLTSDGAYTLTGTLADGHEIVVDMGSIVSITEPGSVTNTLTVRIMFDGEDLTEYYDIKVSNGILTVRKIAITVSTEDVVGVYDSTPHGSNGRYTVSGGSVLDSHKIVVISYNEITDPGTGDNKITFVIVPKELNSNDESVLLANDLSSRYYSVTKAYGTITVKLRDLTISTGSITETYNGEFHYCTDYTVSRDNGNGEGLLSIHTVRMSGWIGQKNQNVATPTRNYAVYTLYDKYGNELNIHKYYDVTELWGTLTVTKRDITFVTGSRSREFDGYYLTCTDATYKNGSLVEGHRFQAVSRSSQIAAGSCRNDLDIWIRDASENDVTDNYNITYEYGTLTVTRRIIEITFSDITQMYNAQPVDFSLYYSINKNAVQSAYMSHYMDIYMDKTYIAVSDSGTYTVMLDLGGTDIDKYRDSYDIRFYYVDADGTRIRRDTASITIMPIPLTVYINDAEKFYDGQYAVANYTEHERNKSLYPDGQSLFVYMNEKYVDASAVAYRYTASCYIWSYDGNLDYTDNYDVTVIYTGKENSQGFSLFTIKHRPMNITNAIYDRVWEYDGSEHFLSSVDMTPRDASLKDALADGHYFLLVLYPTIVNVGKKDNIIVYDIIDSSTGKSVKHNYAISEDWGTIEITPRPIIVITGTEVKQYDGETLEHRHITVLWKNNELQNGLVSYQHEIVLDPEVVSRIGPDVLYDEYGNVIGVQNILSVIDIINNVNGTVESLMYNYSIVEYRYGELIILPRDIIVTTGSATMEYNGVDTLTKYSFTYRGTLTGHIFKTELVTVLGSRFRVGVSQNVAVMATDGTGIFVTADGGKTDVSRNYTVVFDFGSLEVTPITLKLQPNYVFGEYNGSEWTVTSGRCTTKKKLLDNGTDAVLYVRAYGSAINAGIEKSYIMTAVVRDAYGIGVYSNGMLEYYSFVDISKPMYVNVEEGTLAIYYDGTVKLLSAMASDRNYVVETDYRCSYDFELLDGEINISKRRIYVSAPSITNYTEGMTLPESWISQGTMAPRHYLFAPTYVTQKDGELVTTIDKDTIMIYSDPKFESMPLGSEVFKNYEFIIKDGTVE